MYIVKPSDLACGKGIFFATEFSEISTALKIENGQFVSPKKLREENKSNSDLEQIAPSLIPQYPLSSSYVV